MVYTLSSWNHHRVSFGDLPFLQFFTYLSLSLGRCCNQEREEEGSYSVEEQRERIDYIKWHMTEFKSRMYLFSRAREHGEDADADRTHSHRWRPRIIQNIYKG